ncbi:methylthioribulose 1-phosphate dehydratase [Desertimonas flava]|uniref:methylthioribulose 1-phosphate dehydratase n=1 Tax=Desertimonas flava TaxID=2064846 RepID=UPI000E345C17|nr:methylthioribulose 1-phosphate dehydratase [Desertimonas flava]
MSAPLPDRSDVLAAGARLAAEAARFNALGWMRATAGNLSEVLQRDPLFLAITASGLDKGELEPHDVAVVGDGGTGVDVPGVDTVRPSAEAGLHARVAALTGAGAVVHVHTLNAVEAAHRWPDGVVLRDVEMLKSIGRRAHDDVVRVPVIANSQDMGELGDRFEAAYDRDIPGVIVAGHGSYVWGADLQQARWHTEGLDWLFGYALRIASGVTDGAWHQP